MTAMICRIFTFLQQIRKDDGQQMLHDMNILIS